MRPATYSTLIGLLAVTGLRSSEVIALDDPDVDFTDGVITIRRTKFRKSRLVTVHASTVEALRRYVRLRDKACRRPATEAFFVGEAGRRLSQDIIEWTFAKLSRQTGLRRLTDWGLASMTFVTDWRSRRWSDGTGALWTSKRSSRRCRPTSGTPGSEIRTGT